MEENKYYTPEIEEFRIGFEYEFYNPEKGWVKSNIDETSDLFIKSLELQENFIRVKYLDIEDIEELNFVKNSWSEEDQLLFEKGWFILTLIPSNNRLIITDKNRSVSSTDGKYYHYMLFDGNIKNKSELKVLIKQLGI